MPVINVPVPDPREPGRVVDAWIYAEEITLNHAREEVKILARGWNSTTAAHDPDAESWTRSLYFPGPQYRAIVAANPSLFVGVAGQADALIQAALGGEVSPATLPNWGGE
ncbi:hypothetical protein [Paludisphaera sp.]|uniref:hypothetical protein n=1 Tax=Paludisphaera sp. TaxID=2017432 RepID=UPI00301D6410